MIKTLKIFENLARTYGESLSDTYGYGPEAPSSGGPSARARARARAKYPEPFIIEKILTFLSELRSDLDRIIQQKLRPHKYIPPCERKEVILIIFL